MKVPPPEYWDALLSEATGSQPATLRELFEARVATFSGIELGPPTSTAIALLERLAADGFLVKQVREIETSEGETETETTYVRDLPQARAVEWVIAIHGMNSTGAWQESLSWLLSTTWGSSVC